jgi:hypothetical protein
LPPTLAFRSVPAGAAGSTPRVAWGAAVEGPWINSSILHFLENKKAGLTPPGSQTSMESDSFMVAMPLAALQACRDEQPDDDDDLAAVVSLVNAHEPNSVQFIMPSLRLLRQVIRSGNSIADCLSELTGSCHSPLQFRIAASTALANLQRPHSEFSDEVGSACANPASLTCALHAVLCFPSYTDAIRAVAFAGGCSCSRCALRRNFAYSTPRIRCSAVVAGSLLAAVGGMRYFAL